MRTTARYAIGVAVCSGTAPRNPAGKPLTGTVTTTITGMEKTKRFSFRIGK